MASYCMEVDLAEFWKSRKDFPRQKWARKRLPGKWRRGCKRHRGCLNCWQLGSWARWWHWNWDGRVVSPACSIPGVPNPALSFLLCHLKCHSLKLFSLGSSHTVSAWESFAFFAAWSISPHPSKFSSSASSSLPSHWHGLCGCFGPASGSPHWGSWQYCSPPGSLF